MIYESPDGGNTVYVRHNGEPGRTLVYKKPTPDWHIDPSDLNRIMHEAHNSVALQDLLIKLKTVWELVKTP